MDNSSNEKTTKVRGTSTFSSSFFAEALVPLNPYRWGHYVVGSASASDMPKIGDKLKTPFKYQKEQLIQNGIQPENIRIEVGSANNQIKNRLVFQKLIQEELKSNDLLMFTKIDRCSRNILEFLKLQDILFKKTITFVALDLPTSIDLTTNKLIATTLSGIAEFENNRRKERRKQGIRAAQQKGKYTGRKSIINQTLIQKVKNLKENKNLSVTEIAKVLGISRPTIYKILKQELNYVPYNRLIKVTKTVLE